MVDWSLLRFVLEASRAGSASGAARNLGVNIATVSRQIARAEEALDAKLFDRRNKGLFPTKEGLAAIKTAMAVEKEIEDLEMQVIGANQSEAGTIRFSMPLNVMQFGFTEHIRAFQKAYPKISFEINATDDVVDFEALQADVVIRVGENPPDSLWGHIIAKVGVSFFASSEFMDRWGSEIKANPDTVELPYIELYTANSTADRDELISRFPNAVKVASCNGMDSLIPMVRDGIGAGRMMRYMGQSFDDLEMIFACDEKWTRTVWILTHRDYASVRRIRLFLDFIKDRFAARDFNF